MVGETYRNHPGVADSDSFGRLCSGGHPAIHISDHDNVSFFLHYIHPAEFSGWNFHNVGVRGRWIGESGTPCVHHNVVYYHHGNEPYGNSDRYV
jgi:hypothetical protein